MKGYPDSEEKSDLIRRWLITITLVCALFTESFSQTKDTVIAARITQPPKIDGNLDDPAWSSGYWCNKFYQASPEVGVLSSRTHAMIVYDDEAIYIAAKCLMSGDSIWMQLTDRDNLDETDAFYVGFDTYHDGQNAFVFGVSPRNVQADVKFFLNTAEDVAWDAVWDSKVSIQKDGWYAELKIPYSALRFPKVQQQDWTIDFYRQIRINRHEYNSCNFDPTINGFTSQFQPLTGLLDITPPLRLSLSPYGTVYYNIYNDPSNDFTEDEVQFKGGMDIKWGVSESFTLDATLVPDFGQVQSDNIIYNLTALEVQYDEKRPFFTEGTELFNKAELFYSRRVGFVTDYYDEHGDTSVTLVNPPVTSNLLNASKFSGRTNGNLGIGIFNAITGNTWSDATTAEGEPTEVLVDPLSNYNVLVFDQSLKNNSYVTFTNTNVIRDKLGRDANVSSLMGYIANKKQTYAGFGYVSLSNIMNKAAEDTPVEVTTGYLNRFAFSKISGNLTFEVSHRAISKEYDVNDLGFLPFNNQNDAQAYANYDIYEPFGKFNELHAFNLIGYRYRNSDGAFVGSWLQGNYFMLTRKYFGFYTFYFADPFGYHDYYEPRVEDRYYKEPALGGFNVGFSTDYRKHVAVDMEVGSDIWDQEDRIRYRFFVAPRIRIGDRLLIVPQTHFSYYNNSEGWVETISEDEIIFGSRNVTEMDNLLEGTYYFSNNLSLGAKVRYYMNKGIYDDYFTLNGDGTLSPTDYSGNANYNFNAWNIDMNVTWWFLPGSEMNLVWKNSITGFDDVTDLSFGENWRHTFDFPQNNNISIRVRYYIDYQMVKTMLK